MVDYNEVLADLRRRRAALRRQMDELDGLIAGIEKMAPSEQMSLLGVVSKPAPVSRQGKPYEGLTVREAALKCLGEAGHPMRAAALAERLLAGGLTTNAKNFRTTLYATLARYPEQFFTKGGEWALAEWKSAQA